MSEVDRIGGRFVIETLAGRGGMGSVYRARDQADGALVALKVLHTADAETAARFTREAEALSRISHPHVVRWIAHGKTSAGEPFLVMQWIEGDDLAARLGRGPIAEDAALQLARALADALDAVHASGIIHRDVKPANVLLVGGDVAQPMLADFGVARDVEATAMTATGTAVGTPQYMAPEQIQAQPELDHRADLFALGCVLFECLSGRPPFSGAHLMAVLAKILIDRAPSLREAGVHVSAASEALVASLLAKSPHDRPPRAADVVARIDFQRAQRPTATPGASAAAPRDEPGEGAITTLERRSVAVVLATGVADAPDEHDRGGEVRGSSRIISCVRPHGGELWTLGDDRILVTLTGERDAATDQAARAARAALALRAVYPRVRAAVCAGAAEVARVPVGEVIDRAAALLARTNERGGASVVVDEASAGLLQGRFQLAPLRGDGATRDSVVIDELDAEAQPRTLLGRATPFVGRERELALLLGTFDEVVAEEDARAVLVTAPSGAGKSRLRHELVARLRARAPDVRVYLARAEALKTGSPLDLLAGLVRAAASISATDDGHDTRAKLVKLAERDVPEAQRDEVAAFLGEIVGARFADDFTPHLALARQGQASKQLGALMARAFEVWLTGACTRGRAPTVLILEDLHWGDQQTARVLDGILGELAHRPLFVLALARPEVRESFPKLWSTRATTEVSLSPLGARACERLVRGMLAHADDDVVSGLVQRADGNAFYLEELIRARAAAIIGAPDRNGGDVDAAPVSVLAMVQARFERLDPVARQLMRAASVFGEAFRRDAAVALTPRVPAADVDAAFAALVHQEIIVVRSDDGDLAFRHALVREAAYATLTDADRRLGHAIARAWLEKHGERDALLLAEHAKQADDMAGAATFMAKAARQAFERNDFIAAIARADRAVELGVGGDALIEARLASGKSFAALGRFADAEAQLVSANAASASAGEDASQTERRMEILRELFSVGTFRQGEALARAGNEALALATTLSRDDLAMEASAALALVAHSEEKCDVAVERLTAAIARPSAARRTSTIVGMSGILLYHAGEFAQLEALTRPVHAHAAEMSDGTTAAVLSGNMGISLAARGLYEEARGHFREARAGADKRGLATISARSISLSVGHHIDLLDYDAAEKVAREVCDLGRSLEFATPRVSATIDLAFVAVRKNHVDQADALVDSIAATVAAGTSFHGWLWRERVGVVRAEIALLRGDLSTALALADAQITTCRGHRRFKYEAMSHAVRARALAAMGRGDHAVAEMLRVLEQAATRPEPAVALRVAATLHGIAHEQRALDVANEAATTMLAGLPAHERGAFHARLSAFAPALFRGA